MCIGSKVTPTDGEINSLFVGKVLLQIIYRWPTVRLEPAILSVITPYGLRHGMDAVRTDAGAVRTNTVRTKGRV